MLKKKLILMKTKTFNSVKNIYIHTVYIYILYNTYIQHIHTTYTYYTTYIYCVNFENMNTNVNQKKD